MAQWNDQESQLRQHLVSLLTEPNAHATFDQAVENMPVSKRGVRPENSEHSAWELLEHLRIAQEDILAQPRLQGAQVARCLLARIANGAQRRRVG